MASQEIVWECLKRSSCFLRKGGAVAPVFSAEPGNLMNKHSFKFSGLANNRTVDVSAAADGSKRVVVAVTTGRKAFAGKKAAPKGKKAAAKAPEGRVKRTTVGAVSAKKALKAVAAITAAQRPDLKDAAVRRASAVQKSICRKLAAGPKPVTTKHLVLA